MHAHELCRCNPNGLRHHRRLKLSERLTTDDPCTGFHGATGGSDCLSVLQACRDWPMFTPTAFGVRSDPHLFCGDRIPRGCGWITGNRGTHRRSTATRSNHYQSTGGSLCCDTHGSHLQRGHGSCHDRCRRQSYEHHRRSRRRALRRSRHHGPLHRRHDPHHHRRPPRAIETSTDPAASIAPKASAVNTVTDLFTIHSYMLSFQNS